MQTNAIKLLAGVAFLFLSGCATQNNWNADTWSAQDTRREIAYQLVNVYDAVQTSEIRKRPDVVEVNPVGRAVMGAEPKAEGVAMYFTSLAVSHYLISRVLPPKLRKYWQYGTIGYQGATVFNNCYELSLGC